MFSLNILIHLYNFNIKILLAFTIIQTDNIQMGAHLSLNPTVNWIKQQKLSTVLGKPTLLVSSYDSTLNAEQYLITVKQKKTDSLQYQQRKHQLQNIVSIYDYRLLNTMSDCFCVLKSWIVITQRIPYRLSMLNRLSRSQAFYILKNALNGYHILFQHKKSTYPTCQMIGFLKNGDIKVWINEVWAYNQSRHISVQQNRVIDELINTIQDRILSGSEGFGRKFHEERYKSSKNFSVIKQIVGKYCQQFNQSMMRESLRQKLEYISKQKAGLHCIKTNFDISFKKKNQENINYIKAQIDEENNFPTKTRKKSIKECTTKKHQGNYPIQTQKIYVKNVQQQIRMINPQIISKYSTINNHHHTLRNSINLKHNSNGLVHYPHIVNHNILHHSHVTPKKTVKIPYDFILPRTYQINNINLTEKKKIINNDHSYIKIDDFKTLKQSSNTNSVSSKTHQKDICQIEVKPKFELSQSQKLQNKIVCEKNSHKLLSEVYQSNNNSKEFLSEKQSIQILDEDYQQINNKNNKQQVETQINKQILEEFQLGSYQLPIEKYPNLHQALQQLKSSTIITDKAQQGSQNQIVGENDETIQYTNMFKYYLQTYSNDQKNQQQLNSMNNDQNYEADEGNQYQGNYENFRYQLATIEQNSQKSNSMIMQEIQQNFYPDTLVHQDQSQENVLRQQIIEDYQISQL